MLQLWKLHTCMQSHKQTCLAYCAACKSAACIQSKLHVCCCAQDPGNYCFNLSESSATSAAAASATGSAPLLKPYSPAARQKPSTPVPPLQTPTPAPAASQPSAPPPPLPLEPLQDLNLNTAQVKPLG